MQTAVLMSPVSSWWLHAMLLCCCASVLLPAAQSARVAIVGGGVGGCVAAHFLRKDNPAWHIELFERQRLGGRAEEVELDGKVLEVGASIIHGANQYMLSLAREMNLTLVKGDDTGAAFQIWDGREFVFSQGRSTIADVWAVLKRYGVSPLRYKWLSEEAGQRFGGIYPLQQQGHAFERPEDWLKQLKLFDATQGTAANFMEEHLSKGWLGFGAAAFAEELAGAINRINYNQNNSQLNALAGLVSYLPAADPEVYSIAEGNAALPGKLAEAAKLQGLHIGVAVQSVTRGSDGRFMLSVVQPFQNAGAADPVAAGKQQQQHQEQEQHADKPVGSADKQEGQERHQQQQQQPQQVGPFDAVILATPLEGSGLQLTGLKPEPKLPARSYQRTTTSFVTGFIDASHFSRATMPRGDVFVTNSARTPFTVVSSKGSVSAAAVPGHKRHSGLECAASLLQEQQQQQHKQQQEQQQQEQQQEQGPEGQQGQHVPLWKVFSEGPLSRHTLQTLFVNGTVVANRTWAAYPRFNPPERFAPFLLAPGLCYVNALESAASAMEVAAVAGRNCALLVQQHVQRLDLHSQLATS